MNKLGRILSIVWAVLAVASFVSAFWLPIIPKIIGICFGSLNLMVMGAWVIGYVQTMIEKKKAIEHTDEIIKLAEEQLNETIAEKPKRGRPKKVQEE